MKKREMNGQSEIVDKGYASEDHNLEEITKFFEEIGLGTEEERAKYRFDTFLLPKSDEKLPLSLRIAGNTGNKGNPSNAQLA